MEPRGEAGLALLVDGLRPRGSRGSPLMWPTLRHGPTTLYCRRYPGHEQYTRNMATGASNAKLAILLIDVRNGILPQTRRHHRIVTMMGIRHLVLAVNKMDLVGFEEEIFRTIEVEYRRLAADSMLKTLQAIPLCGRRERAESGTAMVRGADAFSVSRHH